MSSIIEVAFRGNRKEFFRWTDEPLPLRAAVIVEADRGEDFGRVHATGALAETRCRGCAHGCGTTVPARAALRLATREDAARDGELDAENESARRRAMERVKANDLTMKLTDAEWQWDRRKLTIYFTAEKRVDFRGLVRDLAAAFRTRIELKQIGVRDEAKRLGGIGRCGREYCSASWLPDLRPVNLGVAKDQKLSLNPQQISGACGRLMCCLRYEHEFYVQSRRRFPKEGRIVVTKVGEEKVMSTDIFNERVTLRSAEGDTRVVTLAELRAEVGGFGELPVMSAMPTGVSTGGAHPSDPSATSGDPTGLHEGPSSKPLLDQAMLDETGLTSEHPVIAMDPVAAHDDRADADDRAHAELVAAADAPAEDTLDDAVGDVGRGDAPAMDGALSDATASRGGEQKRRRRRGRRGGRRLRAAEERRRAESAGGIAEAPGDGAGAADHHHDDFEDDDASDDAE